MSKELRWQREIIKSAKAQGGWGNKWATQWTVGVPDLILCMPEHGLIAMEVKLFDDVTEGWSRKINITAKQQSTLRYISEAGGNAMIGLVVKYRDSRKILLVTVPHWIDHMSEDELQHATYVQRENGSFNIKELLG